ncbi:MAG: Tex family protein [Bacillota bacterium]|nr:Tex family protein [Bacillota bacterium]
MKEIIKTTEDYAQQLAEIFSLQPGHVFEALKLYQEDNTIPFIARYRKDLTGAMDDQTLRNLFDEFKSQENLDQRRNTIITTLNDLGIEDADLEDKIKKASKMTELEDLYRPYKPKKQTRASIAKDRGVEPLARAILELKSQEEIKTKAEEFLKTQKVPDGQERLEDFDQAIEAAGDFLAGDLADRADLRQKLKLQWLNHGILKSQQKQDQDSVYRVYYDFEEPLRKLANHRLLAINRGEKEGFLKVSIELEERHWKPHVELILGVLQGQGYAKELLSAIIDDSFKRLLKPSIDTEILGGLTEEAHEEALKIFGLNLRNALLVPPMKTDMVLALDPGYRNGCKWAVVNGQGTVMDAGLIYPLLFPARLKAAKETVVAMILKHQVQTIVLGNGTASRETEEFLSDLLKEKNLKVPYLIVDEAGASVYSASPISKEELPDMELNLRSAVSLARRILDPLAELVKIDPKSIGVGQYQHDMNQKRLDEILAGVTEGVVNQVGVSLNTASPSLLSYVSGINKTTAKNIVAYREEIGAFKSRDQLKEVKRLGAKTFEQSAGFLRIEDPENPLDNTFVHPESYAIAQDMIDSFGLIFNQENKISKADLEAFGQEKEVGLQTLQDIVAAISKPARDIRDDFPAPVLITEVKSLEDLKEGQILTGVVRNVTAFGAFVDLGVHQDGLIHISQMSDKFVKDPTTVVAVGDVVKVRIIEVDLAKKRIGLSLKNVN